MEPLKREIIASAVCDFLQEKELKLMETLAVQSALYDNPNSFGVCAAPSGDVDSFLITDVRHGTHVPPPCPENTIPVAKYHSTGSHPKDGARL